MIMDSVFDCSVFRPPLYQKLTVLFLPQVNLEKLRDINYCDSDYRKRQTLIAPPPPPKPPATNTSTAECPCDCRTCGKPTKKSDINAIERKFIDEVLVDEIIDTIFPHISHSGLDQQRSKRSVTISRGDLTDQSQRSKRSVASARDKSNDFEKPDEKSSNGIVEIRDDQIRYNVSTPNSQSPKRPYSKRRMGVENKDDVFTLYSTEIKGKTIIFTLFVKSGTTVPAVVWVWVFGVRRPS